MEALLRRSKLIERLYDGLLSYLCEKEGEVSMNSLELLHGRCVRRSIPAYIRRSGRCNLPEFGGF